MGYRVKTVAELLGIPRNTLIAWERRLGIVEPARSDAGYREYTEADVERLRRLKALVDGGLKVGEAWSLLKEEASRVAAPTSDAPGSLRPLRDALRDALLAFDRPGADAIAGRLVMVPAERLLDDVITPLLREVGDRWARGEVSVSQEHFAAGWCRERLLLVSAAAPPPPLAAPEVTCATPAGERHELGLMAVALRLRLRGFNVTWLGADVPTADLLAHLEARRPFAVCVSFVQGRPVSEVAAWVRDVRRKMPAASRLVVGGLAVAEAELPVIPGVTWSGHGLPPWLGDTRLKGVSASG